MECIKLGHTPGEDLGHKKKKTDKFLSENVVDFEFDQLNIRSVIGRLRYGFKIDTDQAPLSYHTDILSIK